MLALHTQSCICSRQEKDCLHPVIKNDEGFDVFHFSCYTSRSTEIILQLMSIIFLRILYCKRSESVCEPKCKSKLETIYSSAPKGAGSKVGTIVISTCNNRVRDMRDLYCSKRELLNIDLQLGHPKEIADCAIKARKFRKQSIHKSISAAAALSVLGWSMI